MAVAGRSISMFSLITDGILEPGDRLLTFDYLGKRYTADLLPEGTIQSDGHIYASPYAWASHCKNLVNPEQKTAIGWGHIRYKGIKLSQYKNIYMKKNKLVYEQESPEMSLDHNGTSLLQKKGRRKKVVSDNMSIKPVSSSQLQDSNTTVELPSNEDLANDSQKGKLGKGITHQAALSLTSELVDCVSFEGLGETQPFEILISSNMLLLMDFHSHLCWSEVVGYLGGLYNQKTKTLQIVKVYPCRCSTTNEDENAASEKLIQKQMTSSGLQLVGWYHSHPSSDPLPSVNDVTQQLVYQEVVISNEGDFPCVGMIISPNLANRRNEIQSTIMSFWVKRRDAMHATPLKLQYTISWEQFLSQDVADEMNLLAAFYRHRHDSIDFKAKWREDIPFVHKLKTSLANVQPKFTQEKSDETFFTFIDQLVFQ